MRFLFAALTACLALVDLARAQTPIAVVPYSVTTEGAISIAVTIDGRGPYDFLVDTGATLTLVFENFARRAPLQRAEGNAKRILSISGARVFEPYIIGDLTAGTLLSSRQTGVVLPDWEAPRETPAGIVGLDVLENFALAFDVRAKTISFYSRDGLPAELTRRMRKAPMRRTRYDGGGAELYTVNGRINGEPIRFIVDLGLATTLVNYAAGDALFASTLSIASGRTATTNTRLDDVFDDRTKISAGTMRAITVSTQRWSRKTVWIYDAPLFDELGVQRLAYGLLGADLLTRQDFAIDFSAERIYFAR
ncbi:MAG: aspartyl protease family protein [Parvularculaceae bacterium]